MALLGMNKLALQLSQTGTCYCSGNDLIVEKTMQSSFSSIIYIHTCVCILVWIVKCVLYGDDVKFHSNNCLLVYFDDFIVVGSVVSFSRPCTLHRYICTPRFSLSAYPQNIHQGTFSEMI